MQLLLKYLPKQREQWQKELATQRATYQAFVNDLTANPFAKMYSSEAEATAAAAAGGKKSTVKVESKVLAALFWL